MREPIRGWTDNGKIMPPWITLSGQREGGGGGGEDRMRERGMQVQRRPRRKVFECLAHGYGGVNGGKRGEED